MAWIMAWIMQTTLERVLTGERSEVRVGLLPTFFLAYRSRSHGKPND
jgi:hypothetical protein